MHKSKGNAIWFDDAVETMGADVMRWIYCTQELSSTLNFGYKKAKFVRGRFFNMLWNSYAFFVNYARLIGFHPSSVPSDVSERPDFDQWILAKLQLLIKKCRASFEVYDLRSACRAIEEFLDFLSNWYIRNNRRRYWHSHLNGDSSYAYETLFECLSTMLRLLAPVLPMITEACYQNMIRAVDPESPESVHLTDYPVENEALIENQLVEQMDAIARLHKLALSAREQAKIKIRQPLSRLLVAPSSRVEKRAVERFADLLKDGLNVKQLELLDMGTACPVDSETLSVVSSNDGWLAFDVELTEELQIEGLMREFLRKMQVLRKEIGLEIENRIAVTYKTDSVRMQAAIEGYEDFLRQELLCGHLSANVELATGKNLKIAGEEVLVEVQKVEQMA
jgi:isoleucyl-tRNA synthetase